jgi:LacI family transcriptional regulator
VTLLDVAEYAGVSASTASRALNGRGELSSYTRAAVLEAADAPRSLRTRTTYTVGFVVPDVSSPFYASALKGAQGALEQAGYRVMLMDCEQSADGEVAALRTLLAHRVDGLLLATVGIERELFDGVVGRSGVPCVFFDSALSGAGDGTVLLDNVAGIDLLVEHMVAHGHRSLGFLAGSSSETSGRDRLAAFQAAMRRHGLDVRAEHVGGKRWTREDGYASARRILTTAAPPTALVASSVELALGALPACRYLGLTIPGDLALATFDDAYFTELLDPPLTAVAYDPSDVGRVAAELLVEAMRDDEPAGRDVTIPVDLVIRRSCGCQG